MKKQLSLLVGCLVSIIVVVGIVGLSRSREKSPSALAHQNNVFEQILKKGEIRCSYLVYSPLFRKDPNSGEMSGIFHDIMEEIGKRTSLRVVWAEEVGYEAILPGLNAKRYDVFAGGLWPNASRARAGVFSIPVCYSVITAWGNSSETRFSENLDGVDSPSIRIACIDGALEDIIARNDFPKAQRVSLPDLSPFTQSLLNITSGKADITFAEPSVVAEFSKQNPGKLKQLANGRPLRIFGNTLVIGLGQLELKEFLDAALSEILFDGTVDKILKKYEPVPNAFPRAALPYQSAQFAQ